MILNWIKRIIYLNRKKVPDDDVTLYSVKKVPDDDVTESLRMRSPNNIGVSQHFAKKISEK